MTEAYVLRGVGLQLPCVPASPLHTAQSSAKGKRRVQRARHGPGPCATRARQCCIVRLHRTADRLCTWELYSVSVPTANSGVITTEHLRDDAPQRGVNIGPKELGTDSTRIDRTASRLVKAKSTVDPALGAKRPGTDTPRG